MDGWPAEGPRPGTSTLDAAVTTTLAVRWARIMACHVPARVETTGLVLDVVDRCGVADSVVDLGGGTGAMGEAVLERVAGSSVWLVDDDPVMLGVAGARLGDRVHRVDHDVADPGWVDRVGPRGAVGAVVCSLVLHMLPARAYRGVVAAAHRALRPGGLWVDWDLMPLHGPLGGAAADARQYRAADALRRLGEDVAQCYTSVALTPGGAELLQHRAARHPERQDHLPLPASGRREVLRAVGFSDVVEVARLADVAVLVARR